MQRDLMGVEVKDQKRGAKTNVMSNTGSDELYTPGYAVDPVMEYLPKGWTYWEPCSGNSNAIVNHLNDSGRECIGTGNDFLVNDPDFHYDAIITNPPYSIKDKMIKRCYRLGKPFALLLPITALEGKRRGKMFREFGLEVLVLDTRTDFSGKGQCWFNVSWFCRGILPEQLMFAQMKTEKTESML